MNFTFFIYSNAKRGRPRSLSPPVKPEKRPPKKLSPAELNKWKNKQRVRRHRYDKYIAANNLKKQNSALCDPKCNRAAEPKDPVHVKKKPLSGSER